MPSGFATLDTGFPDLSGMNTDKKVQAMEDYLVQLLEQLRYTLHNLSVDNFNKDETLQWINEIVKNLDVKTVKTENLDAGEINTGDIFMDGEITIRDEDHTYGEIGGTYSAANGASLDIWANESCLLRMGNKETVLYWTDAGHSATGSLQFGDGCFLLIGDDGDPGHRWTIEGNPIQDHLDVAYGDTLLRMEPDTIEVTRKKNGVTTTYDLFDKLDQI